jgi:DNA modification methylase
MANTNFKNRLNDLNPKEWIKFQKSWFIHNPSPRKKEVIRHPAKFPESLAQEFIEFFTKRDQVVLDPMAGTGSTLVAALRCGRNSFGIELNPSYVEIANQVLAEETNDLGLNTSAVYAEMIAGDAARLPDIVYAYNIPTVDYVLTSPPYWNMLHSRGAETQRNRRNSTELDVTYSNDPNDLGNIKDYDEFLERLVFIYKGLKSFLRPQAYLTIIVKNVKKGGRIYPLAWDLAHRLSTSYQLKDERIWCQDNQRLAPYGIGSAWVSNTFHHYCLQFRNE